LPVIVAVVALSVVIFAVPEVAMFPAVTLPVIVAEPDKPNVVALTVLIVAVFVVMFPPKTFVMLAVVALK
jgi:hypothetical protein